MMNFDKNLSELFIDLPSKSLSKDLIDQGVLAEKLLFISGELPMSEGRLMEKGRVGVEVSPDKAKLCARQACVWCLSVVNDFGKGSLNKVSKIVKLEVDVATGADFKDHDRIADGASELLEQVFGKYGKCARSVRGVASLPKNSVVQVSIVVEMK